MGILTEYPIGLALLCPLFGALYAVALYYHDVKLGLKQNTHRVMFAFRFLSVTVISFLLLNPLIRESRKIVEKPIVIIGVDNSKSMVMGADSADLRRNLPAAVKALSEKLEKKCDVRIYSFGNTLENGFDGSFRGLKTDMSSFFHEVSSRYANRNAAALVLAGDGIYNQGVDPYYAARGISYPIYTVAVGDTAIRKDAIIRKILVNRTVYKGDKFPVEVLVELDKCQGTTRKLSLSQGGKAIDSKEIRANGDRVMQKAGFLLEAKETGIVRYTVTLGEVEGERSVINNTASFVVEVLDQRQKIAIICDAPHPDITAIRQAIEGSSHMEAELIRVDALPNSFEKYDLVVLNQLPSVTSLASLDPLLRSRIPLLFIIGPQTDLNALNRLNQGLVINSAKNSFAESQPVFSDDFPLFTLNKNEVTLFNDFPPLQCPFGTYQYSPLSQTLCAQKFGNIATHTPMILFTRVGEKKVGFITGENIWRWRISCYIKQNTHEAFDLLIDRMARYLATREDKSFFRIRVGNRIAESEPVEMEAELFNPSYELINEPDINLTITDQQGKNYPFVFSRTTRSYYLNAGLFPVGEYSYQAVVKVGNQVYSQSGRFFVEQVNLESSNLVADHNLLYRIAASHDGKMVPRDSMTTLADKILAREDLRSVSIRQDKMSDLVGNPWLFAVIILLLAAEWVIRKREGL
ncbi:MAG TPA: hypothetical protein PKG48_12070 [Bacteroidales bacterium]|nr:hypothetical protein [Bacteroidales bacterium]HPS61724.1 hypothetical protein [Bacteroidales bacterium]